MDVLTFGHEMQAKFWQDSPDTIPVRWCRLPYGTRQLIDPVDGLPLLHSFMYVKEVGLPWQVDPVNGQVGMLTSTERYYKGARNLGWFVDGSYVGSPRQWLQGSDVEVDPPLTWQLNHRSLECAAQQRRRVLYGCGRRETHDNFNDPLS